MEKIFQRRVYRKSSIFRQKSNVGHDGVQNVALSWNDVVCIGVPGQLGHVDVLPFVEGGPNPVWQKSYQHRLTNPGRARDAQNLVQSHEVASYVLVLQRFAGVLDLIENTCSTCLGY